MSSTLLWTVSTGLESLGLLGARRLIKVDSAIPSGENSLAPSYFAPLYLESFASHEGVGRVKGYSHSYYEQKVEKNLADFTIFTTLFWRGDRLFRVQYTSLALRWLTDAQLARSSSKCNQF